MASPPPCKKYRHNDEDRPLITHDAFQRASSIQFPTNKILPRLVQQKLQQLAVNCNTSLEMLLAGLIPAVAAVLGPTTYVKRHAYLMPMNIFSLAVSLPGEQTSNAFTTTIGNLIGSRYINGCCIINKVCIICFNHH